MRILILSYFYAPMLIPRAFRWHSLAQYWQQAGHSIHALAGWEAGLAEQETLEQIAITRVQHPLLKRYWVVDTQMTATAAPTGKPNAMGKLRNALVGLARWGYTQLYWPDSAFLWQTPARQAALKMPAPDVLISVSPFFSSHWVALQLRKHWHTTRWIADYGDPFSPQQIEAHNNRALYRQRNHAAEAEVLKQVDAVSVTTEKTRELYAQSFPAYQAKLHVIPPLFSTTLSQSPPTRQSDKIKLVFTGKLYAQVRPPDGLLALLVEVSKAVPKLNWELHFYGDVSQVAATINAYAQKMPGKIHLHGVVDRAAAQNAIENADVLVNLGNRTQHQLPSKVVDYAATGKPILHLACLAQDASSDFFSAHPGVLNVLVPNDQPTAQATAQTVQFFQQLPANLSLEYRQNWLAQFSLPAIARQYAALWETENA